MKTFYYEYKKEKCSRDLKIENKVLRMSTCGIMGPISLTLSFKNVTAISALPVRVVEPQ